MDDRVYQCNEPPLGWSKPCPECAKKDQHRRQREDVIDGLDERIVELEALLLERTRERDEARAERDELAGRIANALA